jgi:hypothetical protein
LGVESELRVGRKSGLLWECGEVGARGGDHSPYLSLSIIHSVSVGFFFTQFFSSVLFMSFFKEKNCDIENLAIFPEM